jgi:type VI secretion system protein ImpK
MGFKGRYCHAGDQFLIDQLKTSNLKVLTGSSVGIPSLDKGDLFPEGYPVDAPIPSVKMQDNRISKFVLLGLAFPILLFLGLYVVYAFILNNVGESLIG